MRGLVWRGADGELLTAPAGALVTSDWHELRVPATGMVGAPPSAGRLAAPVHWIGSGWSLTLPAGWLVTPIGTSWMLTPR